jgi:FkbM family methyltransferase
LIASRAVGESDYHLRLPQILSIDRIESLLVFDPFLTLQMGHFVRATAALATPFNRELDAGEDFDYYVRLWQHFRCVKISRNFFVARQGERSRGPRSATAEQWGNSARSRLAQERAQRGLNASSPETLAIKNTAVRDLQAFYCGRALADATNYLALARQMPYRGSHSIEICGAKAFEMYSDNDDPVCLSLAWTGGYMDTTSRLWHTLCVPARVILDIGAHTGFYGLLAARSANPECKIFCFEALGDCYERLRMNITANGLTNVTAVRAEVGRECGQVNLIAFAQEGSLSSRPTVIGDRQRVAHTERVEMLNIDDFLPGHGGQVDLVRIGVAGADLMALSGMTAVVSRDRPDILIELAPCAPTREIEHRLTTHGYRHFVVDQNADRLTALTQLASRSEQSSRTLWSTTRSDADTLSIAEKSGIELAWT